MKLHIILVVLLVVTQVFCDQDVSSVDTENSEQCTPSRRSANWLYIPAVSLMTWGVYELGEEISDDGWTYVGAYWGTAAVISIGIISYQHYTEPNFTVNAGLVGKDPGIFLAYKF